MTKKTAFALLYLLSTLLFIISFILLNKYGMQFAGYWTEKVIAWQWLVLTPIFIWVFWQYKTVKAFLAGLVLLLIGSILAMAIPFFGFLLYITTIDDHQRIKLDENTRLELTNQHTLCMTGVYVYQKKWGIFEQNKARPVYSDIIDEVVYNGEAYKREIQLEVSKNTTPIEQATLVYVDENKIGIEYQIQGKRKIIYHQLDDDYPC